MNEALKPRASVNASEKVLKALAHGAQWYLKFLAKGLTDLKNLGGHPLNSSEDDEEQVLSNHR